MSVTDLRYSYVVDQQPIGRLLFRRFCEVSQKYQRYNNFLDVLDKYAVSRVMRLPGKCALARSR